MQLANHDQPATLYMFPASTTCRPILLFCAEHGIELEQVHVDLMSGEHLGADFAAINATQRVPVLRHGELLLTESSSILKYLAESVGSPAYPAGDPQLRARINERMDWFNTGFYMDFGYNLIYPQVLPHVQRPDAAVQEATLALGATHSARWLAQLDEHWIGPDRNHVVGDTLTIADYFGAGMVSMGELIGQRFDAYPNITRWLQAMKGLSSWDDVHVAFNHWAASMQGQPFRRVA
jgi:glutathione S-transferase